MTRPRSKPTGLPTVNDKAAAIDIGSNSFRLEIGQAGPDRYRRLDYFKETVRLGAGLDANGMLTEEAVQRGLACLRRFSARLAGFQPGQVRAVATQTLREAQNRNAFLLRAHEALGYPIEVISGREAARLMLARGKGSIFFTGATASLRGGAGYAAFASAKGGLRLMAQAMARELGPQNIHVAHLIIDAGVDTDFVRDRIKSARGEEAVENLAPDTLMEPASIADAYWYLHQQKRDAWTFEMDLRPYKETW